MMSPPRLDDEFRNFYDVSFTMLPETYCPSLVRRPASSFVRLLVRSWPSRLVPAAGESFGADICPIPCWLCHLMYTHTLMVLQQMSNTPSTNQLHVFSFQVGRSVLLDKDYCLNTSSYSKIYGHGRNAWNLLDFDDQSAAIIFVDTVKYYSIPSVPSR